MSEWVSVEEAAKQLGVRTPAIRARLRRGTLSGRRLDDGRWEVAALGLEQLGGNDLLEADMLAAEASALELELERQRRLNAESRAAAAEREAVMLREQVARLQAALSALVS